ncbi:outer membrane protein transport protein [Xylophilus sp. GW821-FHT01B05]
MYQPRLTALCALLGAALCPLAAHATNGYFSHGYGAKSQGQAGVGIAWGQDALAAATNPANTALVGDRLDVGLNWFVPRRSADIQGNAFGPDEHYSGDGKKNFFIPEFGVTRQLDGRWAVGLAAYGNGGLNTDYGRNPYARFGATGEAGVNLEQLFITPSVAWKANENHSFGVGLNLAYQRFSAKGLGVFSGFSSDPAHVSDQGTDSSLGAGIRLGWTGKVAPDVTLGATWASKVRGKFDDYRGLFANGGRFDVPENYGVGAAWRPSSAWTLGADVQRIRYGQVAAVGNPLGPLLQGVPLGAAGGPGFGWRDITVLKLGAAYQVSSALTLRGGISHSGQPVPSSQTFLNILAPGVVQNHLTLGASWKTASGLEVNGFLAHAFGRSVNGNGSIPAGNPPGGFGGGNANVRLKETILGISFGWAL